MTGMPYDRDGAPHLALIVEHRGRRVLRCGFGRGRRLAQRRGIFKGNGGLCAVRGWQRPPRLGGLIARAGRAGDAGHARNGRRAGENPAFRRDGRGGDGRSAAGGRIRGGRREARRRWVSPASTRWAKRCSPWRRTRRLNGWPPIRAGLSGQDGARLVYFDEDGRLLGSRRRAMTGGARRAGGYGGG